MKYSSFFLMIIFTAFTLSASVQIVEPSAIRDVTALNIAANYLESMMNDVLNSLKLTAMTPEAKQGNWQEIKKYLSQLNAQIPGVYFYVLPDGNYYSLSMDFTNLNLSNRGYFQSLFAGNSVRGFPIYSRSTGKKSALMAAPIIVDSKTIGALGASVFLDELHFSLDQKFALPENYTWFVLNRQGNTMLDKDSDFIFMNPLEQGSESMRKAINKALQNENGFIEYELNGIKRTATYQKLPSLDWWLFFVKIEGEKVAPPPLMTITLDKFAPQLQSRLQTIDNSLTAKLTNLKDLGDSGKIDFFLKDLLQIDPAIVNAAYIDSKGQIARIQPLEYKNFIGSDISQQPHVKDMISQPKPIFSAGFVSVEGFLSVVISKPIFQKKKFSGSINLLLRPEFLIEPLLKECNVPEDYELWIMEKDGRIIYDQNAEEIGLLLFDDPLYKDFSSLLELGKKIVQNSEGEDEYIFLAPHSREKVIKTAVWQTIALHDREWRIVLAFKPYN